MTTKRGRLPPVPEVRDGELRLKGTPVCRGVAIGRAFFFSYSYGEIAVVPIDAEQVVEEVARYRGALRRCRVDLERLKLRMVHEQLTDGAAILEAHLQLLDDPLMSDEIAVAIAEKQLSAENAFQQALVGYQRHFEALPDPFFRERFRDIRDVARRVLGHLRHTVRVSLAEVPAGSIVFAAELSASEAAEADAAKVCAFVTEAGGLTTHAAIVAKAKGIPYIAGVSLSTAFLPVGVAVIVDARAGEVIVAPHDDTIAAYRQIQKQITVRATTLEASAAAVTETADGLQVRLSANVEAVDELVLLHKYRGAGVGLLRSENIFFASDTLPSEEEQYQHYRLFVEQMCGLPLVIRTFDLGGDKSCMGHAGEGSSEPFFVDCRALRFLLQEKTIFKRQLRAILRAAVDGHVSVLFPMVTSLTDLRGAKALVAEASQELCDAGIPYSSTLRLGCMVEVPSAALIADLLAQECDFLSIGTNDLVHYTLAVDRAYQPTSTLYALCHPGLLRLIQTIVSGGQLCDIPVAICGEIASDPRFTPLLLGLGIYELSVACRYLPLVKEAIRRTTATAAITLAQKALSLSTSDEIQELLLHNYRCTAPDDCFYNS